MISRIYRKNFDKFEAKKRTKLGDKAFLEKYIRSFTKTNRLMKVLLPVLMILNVVNVALRIYSFVLNTDDIFNLVMLVIWTIIALCWLLVALVYWTHHLKFHANKIMDWTEELKIINDAQAQFQTGNSIQAD